MSKSKIISGKVNDETKIEFEKLCVENNSNASREIRGFALNYIKRHSASRIPVSQLSKSNKTNES